MQHNSFYVRDLVHDLGEEIPRHVGLWLELLKSPRAGRAEEIAAVGYFQVQADGLLFANDRKLILGLLEVSISAHGCARDSGTHDCSCAEASCEASSGGM